MAVFPADKHCMTKTRKIEVRVSEEQHRYFSNYARQTKRSLSRLVLDCLENEAGFAPEPAVAENMRVDEQPQLVDTTSQQDRDWVNYMVFYADALAEYAAALAQHQGKGAGRR